jgi:O-antigen/teichoic acid export membrane protein
MSLVAVALYGVAVWLVADTSDREVLWLFALVLPPAAINLRWMVLGINRSRAVAVGNVGSQALFMIGVLLLVNDRHDTLHVPLLQSGGELVYAFAVLGVVAREFGVLRPRIDLSAWRRNLREGAPLVVTQFSRALIQSFDVFLVAVVLGTREAGFYGAAYKPVLFFTVTSGLLFNSFLASYSAADSAGAAELFRRTVRLAVFATVPIALALSFGSQLAVTVAFGAAYAPAHVALSILAWGIVLVAVGGAYAIVLIATQRQSLLMRHTIAGAVFNIIVNLAVVPIAGIEGAATVTLASMLLVIALNYRSCARLGLAPSFGSLVRRTPAPLRADP